MSRIDFMNELESLLSDIPIEEKEEALQYYNDYFEDAGANHEEEIIKELVSPQRVAAIIKAELDANSADRENRGYFTEKGYQDTVYREDKFEIVKPEQKDNDKKAGYTDNNSGNTANTGNAGSFGNSAYSGNTVNTGNTGNTGYNGNYGNAAHSGAAGYTNNSGQQSYSNGYGTYQNNGQQATQKKSTNVALIILICILAIPVGLPIICSVFGVLIGVIAAIAGIIIGFGAAGIAMIGVGIALFVSGLIQITVPFIGLVLCGIGLIVLGLGMLFMLLCTLLCKNVLPAIVRGFVNLCRLPFRNRSVMA
jgi:uncharacterized membrane protein